MKEKLHKYRWYFLAIFFLATSFVWYVVYREDRRGILTVAFLDIGQGDSIYIEAPNGNQILLDGGPDRNVLKSLGKVMPFYDRSIDLLALSHPHLDHFGGFLYVLKRYFISASVSSGTVHEIPEYTLLRNGLTEKNIKEVVLKRGQVIDMGGGVVLNVLLPDREVSKFKPHDGMLVMKLIYGDTSIMLTGDMEENLEEYLVSLEGANLKSDILKAGHHGSRTSTHDSFLGYVSPRLAIISSGENNKYGHPNQEVLSRLERFRINVLRTDTSGSVILKSDGEAWISRNI